MTDAREALGPHAWRWSTVGQAQPDWAQGIEAVTSVSPLRRMRTPAGHPMQVETTNAGACGWVGDGGRFRYVERDPITDRPWPGLPPGWAEWAQACAARAGFAGFVPDVCLINRYAPGMRLGLHQDRDEASMAHPVVSLSLGMGAVFLWGGLSRHDALRQLRLRHGDVMVWGWADRLRFHGVLPLASAPHPHWGAHRVNLTFRRAR